MIIFEFPNLPKQLSVRHAIQSIKKPSTQINLILHSQTNLNVFQAIGPSLFRLQDAQRECVTFACYVLHNWSRAECVRGWVGGVYNPAMMRKTSL